MQDITTDPYAQMPPLFRQRPTYLRINLDAIAHNFHALRNAANGVKPGTSTTEPSQLRPGTPGLQDNPGHPSVRIMAILKANAYGHGLIPTALRLANEGADSFGVAFLEEAVLLRQAGIEAPILVLGGLVGYQTKHFLDYHLDLTASSLTKAQHISEEAQRLRRTARIHLKIDTGMNRIGVRAENAVQFAVDAARLPNLDLVGIFSHFVRAQGPDLTLAHQQLEMFNDVVEGCRKHGIEFEDVHMANSASFFNVHEAFFTITRPGLSLFGYPPGVHLEDTLGLEPALSLHSEIVFFKGVRKGIGVGYYHTWQAPEDGWLATLPMGYGDGYPRHLSNVGEVLIGGKRYPSVGNISMDQMMVFTGQDQFDVGEQVTLLGRDNSESISAWDLSVKAGTIPYEILCGWTPRVPRIYEGTGWKPETT